MAQAKPELKYNLIIGSKHYTWDAPRISGLELKELAGVDPNKFSVFEEVPGPAPDKEISNGEYADLSPHRTEKFDIIDKRTNEG